MDNTIHQVFNIEAWLEGSYFYSTFATIAALPKTTPWNATTSSCHRVYAVQTLQMQLQSPGHVLRVLAFDVLRVCIVQLKATSWKSGKKTHKANIKKRIDWFHSVLIFSISSNSYYCGSEVDQRLEQQHTVGWIFTSEWIIVSAALVEWVGTWPCWGGGWVQLSKPACHQNKLTPAQNNTSDAKTAQSLWGTQEMVDWEQFCVFWRERKNSKWLGMTFFSSSAESWRSP